MKLFAVLLLLAILIVSGFVIQKYVIQKDAAFDIEQFCCAECRQYASGEIGNKNCIEAKKNSSLCTEYFKNYPEREQACANE